MHCSHPSTPGIEGMHSAKMHCSLGHDRQTEARGPRHVPRDRYFGVGVNIQRGTDILWGCQGHRLRGPNEQSPADAAQPSS